MPHGYPLKPAGAPSNTGQGAPESSRSHSAHFYSTDAALYSEVGEILAAALTSGGIAVAIATPEHRRGFERLFASRGFDVQQIASEGRWVTRDAAAMVSELLVEGWPDSNSFQSVVGALLDRLAASAGGDAPQIFLFGEMVSVLWESGKPGAALRLEELWNDLIRTRAFHLSCGWPLRFFSRDSDGIAVRKICDEHNHVVPAQGYDAMGEQERRRSAVVWQLKAQALEAEIHQRRRTQETLNLRDAELHDFLENAVVGMHWLAPDGMILWANRTALESLGYSREQYVGHPFVEFTPDPTAVDRVLQQLRSLENVRDFQLRLRCGNGALRWFRMDANAWAQDGRLQHARCFLVDITDQKMAYEAQMKLAAIVESSDDAIASKDLTGIVTSWNAAAERILGYKAEEIIGKSILTIIPPELQGDEPEILRKIQSGERIEHFETIRMTKAGERIDVSLTVSPVRDQTGRIVGAAKILRDITAQKKLEATLHTAERLASVGRLAATVAHEINNPLEAVTNLIYIARRDPSLAEPVRAWLAAADEELQRVSHIARQTLGFYRDTSHPVWISIAESLDEVLAIYERRFRYKDIGVRKDIQAGLRVCVLGGEFKQILSNLISNAIDASPPGRQLAIRAWQSCHPVSGASGIRLTVADSGTGITPENINKIFTPFFTTKKDVGTGLGLWIVRDLLEKKGGTIRCRSRVATPVSGKPSGTVMMIFLPTQRSEQGQQTIGNLESPPGS